MITRDSPLIFKILITMQKFLVAIISTVSLANASRVKSKTEPLATESGYTYTNEDWDFESYDSSTIVVDNSDSFKSVVEDFEFDYNVPEDVTEGSSDDETADDYDVDEDYYNDAEFNLLDVPEDCEEALLWY